jgi:CDP-paratose 2-epimerase
LSHSRGDTKRANTSAITYIYLGLREQAPVLTLELPISLTFLLKNGREIRIMKKNDFRSVVIFGGAGFIGSNWARRLLETPEVKIQIFDNLSRQGSRYNLEYLQKIAGHSGRLQITIGDVRDQEKVARVVKHATEIYHFAAQVAVTTSVEDPRTDFEINVGGTINILEAARDSGNRPFLLFTSTNKVYGNLGNRSVVAHPTRYVLTDYAATDEQQSLDFHSPYGCSKGAADQYVHDYARIYGLPTVVFRMSCIAGPRQFGTEDQGWVAHFLYSALLGAPVTIYGSGLQVRDVLYVDDLLEAFEAVRENQELTAGEIFNVGGGESNTVSLLELMEHIRELTGVRMRFERSPLRPGDQLVYVTNHSKLTDITGWKPDVNLRSALANMHLWFKKNRDLISSLCPSASGSIRSSLLELEHTA